ncbi:WD40 repeat domain-containing protein [Nonomuraea sp. NPDC049152]|uniref:WD40 repeat domain-containing protein n=1 Tax=Nonomuraea sp. NPDC049152 TaxID=3154350 RepID=UPI0033D598B5
MGLFGSWLATVCLDNAVRIWDVHSGECITAIHLDTELRECAWTPGGTRLYVTGQAGIYGFTLHVARQG